MHILVVPLDERPVNTQLPLQVASVGGASISLPPASALPSFRSSADAAALACWMRQGVADHRGASLVVCTDTLVYGGIIPARITHEDLAVSVDRLALLRDLKAADPAVRIIATSLVMRASDSYSNQEEPEYWSRFGRELHALGADLHRSLEMDLRAELAEDAVPAPVPDDVLEDYAGRRLRNHVLNLAALSLVHEGVISDLAITADDTAYYSAGSAEQRWIAHWRRAVPSLGAVLMYPGADEVGATMTARALVAQGHHPRVSVHCADPEGMLRVPAYENVPLVESVRAQARACDATPVAEDAVADLALVVHAPGADNDDWWGGTPTCAPAQALDTARLVRDLLAQGRVVALADVRFTNGADPALVDNLLADGTFWRLAAYGGWNTAGNTTGGVLATAVASWVGHQRGTFSQHASDLALWTRLLDDYLYQTRLRTDYYARTGGDTGFLAGERLAATETWLTQEVRAFMASLQAGGAPQAELVEAHLPWHRPFEIGLRLR